MMELPRIVVDLVQLAYKVLSVTKRALPRSVAYQDHYLTEQEILGQESRESSAQSLSDPEFAGAEVGREDCLFA